MSAAAHDADSREGQAGLHSSSWVHRVPLDTAKPGQEAERADIQGQVWISLGSQEGAQPQGPHIP